MIDMIAPQRFGFEFHIVNAWDVVGYTIKKAGGGKKAVTLVDSEW